MTNDPKSYASHYAEWYHGNAQGALTRVGEGRDQSKDLEEDRVGGEVGRFPPSREWKDLVSGRKVALRGLAGRLL